MERKVPTGKVKFFDEKKGFGFITGEDGREVYLPKSAVPLGARLRPGTLVEFSPGGHIRQGFIDLRALL